MAPILTVKKNEVFELTNMQAISNVIITTIKMRLKTQQEDGFILFSHLRHTTITMQLKTGMLHVQIDDEKGMCIFF